jgi:hypothetical protein
VRVELSFFTPWPIRTGARAKGCFTCEHFHGDLSGGHVVCRRGARTTLIGIPVEGCAYWSRATGADDE